MGLIKDGRGLRAAAVRQCWRFPGWLIIVASVLLVAGDFGREWFRFDRDAISDLEIWRLLSAHFVHLGTAHFLLNAAGLILVWLLVGRAFGFLHWAMLAVASIAAIDLGLWFFSPTLQWYVGLSGVLHGLLAAGIVAGLQNRGPEAVFLGIALLGKLAFEQFIGPMPGSEAAAGDTVVVDAHLYGAIGGAVAAAVLIRVRRAAPI
jgi:rhomboid family GlyGly-CTERM serine protease